MSRVSDATRSTEARPARPADANTQRVPAVVHRYPEQVAVALWCAHRRRLSRMRRRDRPLACGNGTVDHGSPTNHRRAFGIDRCRTVVVVTERFVERSRSSDARLDSEFRGTRTPHGSRRSSSCRAGRGRHRRTAAAPSTSCRHTAPRRLVDCLDPRAAARRLHARNPPRRWGLERRNGQPCGRTSQH